MLCCRVLEVVLGSGKQTEVFVQVGSGSLVLKKRTNIARKKTAK